jgi:hypothetical protein
MPYYMLSVIQTEEDPPPPDVRERIARNNDALVKELRDAGVWVFGGRLHSPNTATVLRATNGADGQDDVLITDGPFAESKEHLAGVLIITAPDLDVALEWGRRQARATTLPIEVRPFHSAVAA